MTARSRLDAPGIAVVLLLCAVWGVQQVASKVALTQGMPPFFQAVVRSAIAGPLLIGWIAFRNGRPGLQALLAADGTLWPGLATGLLFAGEFLALFPGVRLTSASHATVLLFSGAIFTAIGSHLFVPGERLRALQWAGLGLAFAGMAVTVAPVAGVVRQASLTGDLLVIAAAVAWGSTTVVVKASVLVRVAPEKVLAYQLLGALPVLLIACGLSGELQWPDASTLAWSSLLYQAVLVAFASYLTWYWLVARYPAGKLSAFTLVTPLLGVVAAWLLLSETPTPSLGIGLVAVCGGLVLVNRPG